MGRSFESVRLEIDWTGLGLKVSTGWHAGLLDQALVRGLRTMSRTAGNRSAGVGRRAWVAESSRASVCGHVHAGTTDPPKRGATPMVLRAPVTTKAAVAGSGDHPKWKNSLAESNEGGMVLRDGVSQLENSDNGSSSRGFRRDFVKKFWLLWVQAVANLGRNL